MKKYTDKQKVTYLGAHAKQPNSRATIVECLNEHEPDDVKVQGYRYYILVGRSRTLFSAPEWALRSLT